MYDDDDFEEGDGPMGQLYQSGIQRNPERADYALPAGETALEGGEPEFEQARERLSRRQVVALGLGAVFVTAVGAMFVNSTSDAAIAEPDDGRSPATNQDLARAKLWIDLARETASGPIDDLVHMHHAFIGIVRDYAPEDPELWRGIVRLADYALLDRGELGAKLARRLVTFTALVTPPPTFRRQIQELEDLLQEWKSRKR